jgi:hypothetical protein
MPNTEVKGLSGNGTAVYGRGRVARCREITLKKGVCVFVMHTPSSFFSILWFNDGEIQIECSSLAEFTFDVNEAAVILDDTMDD